MVDFAGDVGAPFGHGPVLGPANVRTYASHEVNVLLLSRTVFCQVMLSSVQAYKGGYMAGQQHAWQVKIKQQKNVRDEQNKTSPGNIGQLPLWCSVHNPANFSKTQTFLLSDSEQ